MVNKSAEPSVQAREGRDFYAEVAPHLDGSFFASLWHIVSLGHLVSTDLDRIARRRGLSIADVLMLGTLRIAGVPLRPTDLAVKLNVSNAALSSRTARLARRALIERRPSVEDRRSILLALTPEGAAEADATIAEISHAGRFAERFAKFPEAERLALEQLLGAMHDQIDRDFLPSTRGLR